MEMDKELKAMLGEYQALQNQLQVVAVQRSQARLQIDEMIGALEQLKTSTGAVYRAAGNLLLASTKEEAEKDLADKKETLEVRAGVLGKQEEKLRTRLNELRSKIESAAGPGSS